MFVLTLARFHCTNERIFVLQGYCQDGVMESSDVRAFLGREALPVRVSCRQGLAVRQKYFARGIGYEQIDREYDIWITLPEDLEHAGMLQVWQDCGGKQRRIYRCSAGFLEKKRRMPDGYLETFHDEEGTIRIGGWAVGASPCRFAVYNGAGERIEITLTRHYRQDILDNYPELTGRDLKSRFGFEVSFPKPSEKNVKLVVLAKGQQMVWPVRLGSAMPWRQKGPGILERGSAYLRRNGLKRTLVRAGEKISEKMTGRKESYMSWRKKYLPGKEELEQQRKTHFSYEPLISIAVPLYRTPESMLRALVRSLQAQTYRSWELCLSDGSGADSPLTGILAQLSSQDSRIRYVSSDRQLGISDNTNRALEIARGEFVAFMDHDDLLREDALYECVRKINDIPEADLIYTDEDKVDTDGRTFFEPHFKPDLNIDLLCSVNYICHLVVVSRDLLAGVGDLRSEFDGAQDYDFVLRCVERARRVEHIPKALYHWRSHKDSTAADPASKRYAFEAGKRAVQAHYDRCGINAVVSMGAYPGLYRTDYILPDPEPLISIIIPNKDHIEDLEKCIRSIQQQDYSRYEILVIENNSTKEETFTYYEQLQAAHSNIRVLFWDKPFNYSLINNFGAANARGEYLLLLNNDTQMLGGDCLAQLVGPALRPEVGAVGARLYYPDRTIQHAGVIIGYGGIAGHAFQNMPASANGYFSRIICASDLSAVTAACMLVKAKVYRQLGGLDGAFRVAFNDIDFCLRIRERGLLVVYNPFAELIHYESKSRGYEDTPGKISRFNNEADRFLKKWPDILTKGDPYYNPNLSLDRNDFSLK